MLLFYNIGIRIYYIIVYLISYFNNKARLWIKGRRNISIIRYPNSIWFHFASLGEFEQGRPVLETMRNMYPDHKIVVTFFSPSGYEIRKNTPLADAVYYLPLDTAKNARQFIDAIQPTIAIFTKYEYWYHFFKEMHNRKIPVYIISGIFRPDQIFFKWYGGLNRKILSFVTHFFVQDEGSVLLLNNINIKNTTVSGDTRFDRVWENAQNPKQILVIDEFKNGQNVFIAGSTWPQDEKLIATIINKYPDWKFIIAPHEIGEDKVQSLINLLPGDKTIRFSQIQSLKTPLSGYKILVIDNIGMLSSLYQYGNIAFIGGGFGAGIHNTLEAAAFGLPVIFGPNYSRFKEAHDLIELKAGFSINNEQELQNITDSLISDQAFYNSAKVNIVTYVKDHTGATQTIIGHITPLLKQQS